PAWPWEPSGSPSSGRSSSGAGPAPAWSSPLRLLHPAKAPPVGQTLRLDPPRNLHLEGRGLLPRQPEVSPQRSGLLADLASCGLALVGCEKKSSSPPAASATPGTAAPAAGGMPWVNGDTILIGEIGSLTGSEATFGISTRNAIELALKEVNAAGGAKGKKVEVRVYDDQSKPEEAANAATRLINQDQVLLILGEVASTNSITMARKAQPARVPMISNASTNTTVTEEGDYIFRVCFIDPFQGYVMAKFAHDNLKFNKVAVLKDLASDYSQGLA